MSDAGSLTAGIHLPQAGPAASGEGMKRAAVLAEELGYADVWVSDHLAIPSKADYPPSAYIYEPLAVMAWVGAVTERVRIGTTVLVLPMRNPLVLAKALASIDRMSGGRVILGTAAGWLEREFRALGVPFDERAARTDEAIEILRTVWTEDPVTKTFPVHGASFEDMRTLPHPEHPLPIWIGGNAPAALRRAVRAGDAWHGAFLSPAETVSRVEYLREHRPEPEFVISMRTSWDPLLDDPGQIAAELDEYRAVGVSHIVAEPRQRTIDAYLRSMERMAELFATAGVRA